MDDNTCKNCRWYEPWYAVCCNGKSPNCAEILGEECSCPEFESEETDNEC